MMNKIDLVNQLKTLDLDENQAQAYLELLKKGVLTPLELARETGINRTTVYRILEKLKELGLVEEIVDQYKTKARAVSPEKLSFLISEQEAQIEQKKAKVKQLISQLTALTDSPSSSTKVVYFRGKSGLRQLLWNTLRAKDKLVGYGFGDWNLGVGEKYAEKLRQEIVKRKITSQEILNKKDNEGNYTQVKDYFKYYEGRVIPKSVIEINHDTYIYNDVFAFFHFYEGELFGVEIHNKEIAKTQKQIFELLWKQAKKVK